MNNIPLHLSLDELGTLQIALVVLTGKTLEEMRQSGIPVNQYDKSRYDRVQALSVKVNEAFIALLDNDNSQAGEE